MKKNSPSSLSDIEKWIFNYNEEQTALIAIRLLISTSKF